MSDLKEALYQIEVALYRIINKETILTRQMRQTADQADELMGEVSHLKDLIAQFPFDALKSTTQVPPPVLEEPKPEPLQPEHQPAEPPLPTLDEIDASAPQAAIIEGPAAEAGPVMRAASDTAYREASKASVLELGLADGESNRSSTDPGRLELDLGIKWLSRIGIVALLMGLAMALSYSFPSFSKEMKILTGMVLAAGLYFGGGKLFSNSPILGRILQGGGLSLGYLSLFATFFIPEVRMFTAPSLGLILLFAYVGFVLSLAHRLNSQTVALLSLAFGYYTATYSESHLVAFLSTAILSLGTVGVAKLHQDWKVLPLANLLGAIITYSFWYQRDRLHDDMTAKLYLAYTFILFHLVSLFRGKAGDVVLNQVNSFAFYGMFSLTQSAFGPKGTLEFLIAATQAGSLFARNTLRPKDKESGLSYSLLILALLFTGFGTFRFFDGMTLSAVLTAEALSVGLLALKSRYRSLLNGAAYLFFTLGYCQLLEAWSTISDVQLFLSAAWLMLTGFLLEALPFRRHVGLARGLLLAFSTAIYLTAIIESVPSEWRTIAIVCSGFTLLASGFFLKRKLYRWMGLGWVFLAGGISIIGDMLHLPMGYKILLFILLGVGLLGGSYGYSLLERKMAGKDS